MLNMFCDAYCQTAHQVDGASRRQFRIGTRRSRVKKRMATAPSINIRLMLWASYLSAVQYADVTGFPHAKRRVVEARRRLEGWGDSEH